MGVFMNSTTPLLCIEEAASHGQALTPDEVLSMLLGYFV